MSAPTVPYKQAASPSPRISANLQGLSANVRYKVDWADAFEFVNSALGLLDGVPWAWPASPNMRATSANIEPVGHISRGGIGSAPGEYYESAFVDVTFSSIVSTPPGVAYEQPAATQFDPSDPIEMSSFQVQYAAEMIKVPSGAVKWATAEADGTAQYVPADMPQPSSGSDFIRAPTFNLSLTLHNCLYANSSMFQDRVGKVNISTMWGCKPETVLFDGVSTSRREMSSGLSILDITLNYKWKKSGWNVAMARNGKLYRYTDLTNTPIYWRTDIKPLTIVPPSSRWFPGA
jgi:hypothetical protein